MKGKVVCVTGASRGIGAAIARRMLSADVSKLLLVARKSEDFDNVMAELEDKKTPNQQVIQLVADLSQTDETYRIVNRLLKNSPNIDILINNAGYTAPNSIFEATFSEFVETVNVNVYAPFILIQELLHRGNKFTHVLNVASTAGLKGRAGWSTYSASKAALIAMTESLREELAPLGVRVICVSPGRCATALRRKLAPEEDPSTIMQPESVADTLHYLLSEQGRFVDAENIVIRK
jgi:3-oxoacyl-[acyl-carrier protein] reductase